MDVKKDYQIAIDELNVIVPEIMNKRNSVAEVIEDILDILIDAYILGQEHASQMMNQRVDAGFVQMQNVIYRQIDGMTFADRATEHILNGDIGRLETLTESEFHRVYNNSVMDGVRDTGFTNVTKRWVTVRDDRVRETHEYLEGRTIPMNEDFYTFDGDHAPYPSGFERPENNVNCRCILEYQREL
jgi:hypothetical protein